MIQFSCPNCKKSYEAQDSQAGMKASCGCGQRLEIPKPASNNKTVLGTLESFEPGPPRNAPPRREIPVAQFAPPEIPAVQLAPTPEVDRTVNRINYIGDVFFGWVGILIGVYFGVVADFRFFLMCFFGALMLILAEIKRLRN